MTILLSDDLAADATLAPLAPSGVAELVIGRYQLGSEKVDVLGPHTLETIEGVRHFRRFDGAQIVRGAGGTTPASHSTGAELVLLSPIPATPTLVADPGNAWEADTRVEIGYQIAVAHDDDTAVWRCVSRGRTGTEPPEWGPEGGLLVVHELDAYGNALVDWQFAGYVGEAAFDFQRVRHWTDWSSINP